MLHRGKKKSVMYFSIPRNTGDSLCGLVVDQRNGGLSGNYLYAAGESMSKVNLLLFCPVYLKYSCNYKASFTQGVLYPTSIQDRLYMHRGAPMFYAFLFRQSNRCGLGNSGCTDVWVPVCP